MVKTQKEEVYTLYDTGAKISNKKLSENVDRTITMSQMVVGTAEIFPWLIFVSHA